MSDFEARVKRHGELTIKSGEYKGVYRLQASEKRIKHLAPIKSTTIHRHDGSPIVEGIQSWQTWKKYPTAKAAAEEWSQLYLCSEECTADAAKSGSKPEEVTLEVVPDTAVAAQDEYAERVVSLHVAAGNHASAAVYCAAAAGAVMLRRKAELGWGKGFTTWKESLVLPDGQALSPRTSDRYMALAKEMEARVKKLMAGGSKTPLVAYLTDGSSNSPLMANLPEGKTSFMELLAAFDPTQVNDLRRQAIAEAVRKITNEQSLTQLYFDWGISKPKHKPGGDHGGGAAMKKLAKERHQNEQLYSHEQWNHIVQEFREFALKRKRYVHVAPAVLESGLASIQECVRAMSSASKEA